MARDHARLDLHIWTDEDYRVLSLPAKLLFLQLMSQPKLSYAGALDLAVKRWARAHPDLDAAGVRAALSELDAERFVVVDQDTEEVLVRSFIRNDGLFKQPNVLRAALRQAFDIESPILRAALAVELRRLPIDVTGPAPIVAADELERGARELPPTVKAAMGTRGSSRPTPAAAARVGAPPEQDPDADGEGTQNPSLNPSAKDLGEGSRERETGEPSVPLSSEKVGVPARVRVSAREGREPAPQAQRAEARRLVMTHSPAQPRRVLNRLTTEVIGLLVDQVEPAMIAAGLRVWATKRLAVSFLPELVGEYMRTHLVDATASKVETDTHAVATFERVRAAAIGDADQSPIADVVCADLPAHTTPDQLDSLLREAGNRALAAIA